MKKLLVIVLGIVLVFGLSTVSMAATTVPWPEGRSVSDTFGVDINILPYARLEVPEGLNLGDIDFFDGFSSRTPAADIKLYTNTDVLIKFVSQGFNFLRPQESTLNPVGYGYTLPNGHTNWFSSGGWRGGWNPGDSFIGWTGNVRTIQFWAFLQSINDNNFYEIAAGDYEDTITVTVFAYR